MNKSLIGWTVGLAIVGALYAWTRTHKGQSATAHAADIAVPFLADINVDFLPEIGAKIMSAAKSVLPVGLRNNNPGNMKWDPHITWQGQTGRDPQDFIIFDSMINGIRAMTRELRNYSALHGLNTVAGLISRWSATDQDAYIANVAHALGVDPYETIDVNDADTMTVLVQAIAAQENGATLAATIPEVAINQGVDEGLLA